MKSVDQPVYLSLSEASRLLGVHSTTLRRWADAGNVPVYVTPGGHRRFALADIEALSERRPLSNKAIARTWAERAVDQARSEMQRVEQSPTWLHHLGEHEREHWRHVGMRLMGVVLRYVSAQSDGEEQMLLSEAQTIGHDYALQALQANIPLTTALEVALFFRDSLVDAAMQMPEQTTMRPEASARLLRRISRVLNVVKIAVVAGYEEHQGHHKSGQLPPPPV